LAVTVVEIAAVRECRERTVEHAPATVAGGLLAGKTPSTTPTTLSAARRETQSKLAPIEQARLPRYLHRHDFTDHTLRLVRPSAARGPGRRRCGPGSAARW